jgi:hypothetical protein
MRLQHLISAVRNQGYGVIIKYPCIILIRCGVKKVFEFEHGIRIMRQIAGQCQIGRI